MPSCKLLVSWDLQSGFFATSGGTLAWKALIPNDPGLIGGTFFVQAWALDPAANVRGIATSNGGKGVFGL